MPSSKGLTFFALSGSYDSLADCSSYIFSVQIEVCAWGYSDLIKTNFINQTDCLSWGFGVLESFNFFFFFRKVLDLEQNFGGVKLFGGFIAAR